MRREGEHQSGRNEMRENMNGKGGTENTRNGEWYRNSSRMKKVKKKWLEEVGKMNRRLN